VVAATGPVAGNPFRVVLLTKEPRVGDGAPTLAGLSDGHPFRMALKQKPENKRAVPITVGTDSRRFI